MRTLLLISTLLLFSQLHGQKNYDTWIEAKGKAGFLAAHRSIMGHLPAEHAFACEVSYLLQPKGSKAWHKTYNYPVFGGTVFAGSVGNSELLGNYFGAYAFMNFPFFTSKRYVFSGKAGAGLGYGTKPYDPETNELGMAVSTHLNALINLAVESRFRFGNHAVTLTLDMTHFSNGATKVPNLGLNLPYVSLGYGYRIKKAVDSVYTVEPFEKRWEFGAMLIGSVKEVYPEGGSKYPVVAFNLVGRRYFRPKTAMELSFDVFYKEAILGYHPEVPKSSLDIIQVGVYTGYVLPLEKFHFVLGMGAYIRDKYRPEDFLYHRLGMRYVFDNGININLTLKSHWARADYFEYGIGYTFKR